MTLLDCPCRVRPAQKLARQQTVLLRPSFAEYLIGLSCRSVRIRIVKQPTGEVDGVELWRLIEGRTYDIDASLATLLIVSQWAEPVAGEAPALVVPIDHPAVKELLDRRSSPRDRADESAHRRRRDRR